MSSLNIEQNQIQLVYNLCQVCKIVTSSNFVSFLQIFFCPLNGHEPVKVYHVEIIERAMNLKIPPFWDSVSDLVFYYNIWIFESESSMYLNGETV